MTSVSLVMKVLKRGKIYKYFVQDCLKNPLLDFTPHKMYRNSKNGQFSRKKVETLHKYFVEAIVSSQVLYYLNVKYTNHFKWIQLTESSNYMNMNSCLHLSSNKLKECSTLF